MALRVRCVSCDHVISAPDTLRGKPVPCPLCGGMNEVSLPVAAPIERSRSHLAAARLDDASLVLLFFAYVTGALALVTGFAPLIAGQLAVEWKLLSVLAGLLTCAVLFVTLKYLSEAMRALADVSRAAARVEGQIDVLTHALATEPSAEDDAPRPPEEPPAPEEPAPPAHTTAGSDPL
ncbi:hypothetical protein HY251_07615 [bacterium]|nr:hypothetical protein [bacterium]